MYLHILSLILSRYSQNDTLLVNLHIFYNVLEQYVVHIGNELTPFLGVFSIALLKVTLQGCIFQLDIWRSTTKLDSDFPGCNSSRKQQR